MLRSTLLLSSLLALGLLDANAQTKKNALFIGNSYTHTYDVPDLIANIASSVGDTLIHQSHTPGGNNFMQHNNNATVQNLINQGGWDAVILQEQSQLPAFRPVDVANMVLPYAAALSDKVRAKDSCTEVIFFNTWGRKNGDNQNCSYYSVTCTYQGMDDELYKNYAIMARDNKATLSPVARVWRYIRNNYPNVELYSGDESHQSYEGSYAAALTFNTIIFGTKPNDVTFKGNLSTSAFDAIKDAVTKVAYDSLGFWKQHQMVKSANADFSSTNVGKSYTFEPASTDTTLTYNWYINNVLTPNPNGTKLIHEFMTPGTYDVCLEVMNKCTSTKNCTQVTIENNTKVNALSHDAFSIYPNPVSDVLHIKSSATISQVNIYDLLGKEIISSASLNIDVSGLNIGVYIVKVIDDKGNIAVKQIVK